MSRKSLYGDPKQHFQEEASFEVTHRDLRRYIGECSTNIYSKADFWRSHAFGVFTIYTLKRHSFYHIENDCFRLLSNSQLDLMRHVSSRTCNPSYQTGPLRYHGYLQLLSIVDFLRRRIFLPSASVSVDPANVSFVSYSARSVNGFTLEISPLLEKIYEL